MCITCLCGSKDVSRITKPHNPYKKKFIIIAECFVCNNCGLELMDSDQMNFFLKRYREEITKEDTNGRKN